LIPAQKYPQRLYHHFQSLYENLNFWSKLALIFISGKVFTNMKSHQRIWKMNKKPKPSYTKNSSFHIKSENDSEIFEDSQEVWNFIQSGWFFFLQCSRSLQFSHCAESPWKSNLMFLVGHPTGYPTNFSNFSKLSYHRPNLFFKWLESI
jgi:hypothetical protein